MLSRLSARKKAALIILLSIASIVLALYLCIALYFRERFLPGTWIYGVYCAGKNADSVVLDSEQKAVLPDIRIVWADDEPSYINPEDIGLRLDFKAAVYEVKEKQNPFTWPGALFKSVNYDPAPVFGYDDEKLRECFDKLPRVTEETNNDPEVYIYLDDEEGYSLYDDHSGRLDTEKVYDELSVKIGSGEFGLYLDDTYYFDVPYSDTEKDILQEWDDLETFLTTDLVYDMGAEKLKFDKKIMSFLIVRDGKMPAVDENGDYIIDEELVEKWIDDLCSEYDTYGIDRAFESSTGRSVMVPSVWSDYGTEIDRNSELKYLRKEIFSDEIRDGEPDVHIPDYIHEGFVRGIDDIGDTFVEVDLSAQHLYYYVKGELLIETDIVSGDIPRGWTTPRGTFAVDDKITDTYLLGRDYKDFVSYWMPYFRGIGMHDSDWRDEWGGDIYTYDGSHGCINMNKESAKIIFENIEIGTPVIVYDY